ncbi:DUF3035 domain-containing protein [Sulfitobacter sp. S190]|uniref:DUF3035 domain-containing protein n=1 Tax=Sulfitobacter sp. S190 TaxID=2867022 RepID=UPI0021A6184A|nr:DUF3035 domain-containing protein [Sulfitobacter sp. S190]UWR22197.1 DUF3035 domain-containing protein [Sulfitobacter sp. S190]
MRSTGVLVVTALLLAGCANVGLRDLRSDDDGPDEFGIQPVKSLQQPDSFSDLPPPTPGRSNRADRDPRAEGIAAVGGRATDPNGPIPARDGGLVQYASRLGVQAGIRAELAAEDADFRRRKARFAQYRILPVDRYAQAYEALALDPQDELERWKRAGARVPSAPPAN